MGYVEVTSPDPGVRKIALSDPDRRNALGSAMAAELRAAVAEAATDGTRALVVTGAGSAFCAGADLPELFGHPERPVRETHLALQEYYRAFLEVRELAIPTVAAVNGPAVGAGLNLALACDIRIASPEAVFGATFARIGLHPGGGCSWLLTKALGGPRTLKALLLGENIRADEAVRLGLAEGPEEDAVAAALELAARFAKVDASLARDIKRSVRLATEADDFGAVLEYESWAQAVSASSTELQDWVERFARS